MGVGEQPGRAIVREPGRPPPDPAVLDARVQPASGVEHDVLGFGPAGHLPPLHLVEDPVAGEHTLQGSVSTAERVQSHWCGYTNRSEGV